MSVMTMAQLELLIPGEINQAIAGDIVDINPLYEYLPMIPYVGPGLEVPREDTLGDAEFLSVGGTITAKTPTTFANGAVVRATTIIGDVEMNGLVQAESNSAGRDAKMLQVQSKAKSLGRKFQLGMATGSGASPVMNSLHSLCDASQYTTASTGQALSFELLDELLDLVVAKDGEVDFIMMPQRSHRSLRALGRAMPGNSLDQIELPPRPGMPKRSILMYNGIPVFKNTHLPVTETANGAALTGGALTSVWAGCFDDGSRNTGLTAVYPAGIPAGIQYKDIGQSATADTDISRLVWYTNLALLNRRGLARLPSINN